MQSDLKALEFDGIRRLLEKLTSTPYGGDAARNLEPAPDLGQARILQHSVSAAREAIDAGEAPELRDLPDVRAALRQASTRGAALTPTALHNIRRIMRAAAALRSHVERRPAFYPAGPAGLEPPAALEARLDECLLPSGHLREDATEQLAGLHARLRAAIEEVNQAVRARMAKPDIVGQFEDPERVKWHNQRAVLVLHKDLADTVKSVRRGTTMGGRDLYLEPIEAVAGNNRIEALHGTISAEEQKLLRALTDTVREHLPELERLTDALTWIDLALAAGHLSATLGGHAPQLVDEPRIELNEAYHPLLLLQFADGTGPRPVPLSLRLDPDNRVLLITGPNTGGKTVVLKTLGLLASMAHCGLHIPAEGDCTIGSYDVLMVDVGDHQSLFHHLSTFAGHVEMLKRILAEAGARSLVLLDELGTGTDPEEGAALAMSVMDELIERGVQGIVNTHLSPLKEYAADRPHIRNASMLFDDLALKPTYRLQIGVPGSSLGLIIAEKSGLPAELVERARDHLARISQRSGS